QAPMPGATGYLVEEMVTGAVAEVLLGLRRDPVYGVTLTLGMGGVTAEVLADTVTLILPVTAAQVLEAARGLRLWPLLDGYRGRPKADMPAVAAMAVRLGDLMLGDEGLEEIEINPVMVCETGAVAVDALVRRAT
ncbi:MAG: acetate--CoA ligase family protein, partial [Tabrizicola sp.]